MRIWCATLLKLLWGIFLLLTSFYCLLAYLPYTYCALIKAPPFAFIPWFSHHYPLLYWVFFAVLAGECYLRGNLRLHSVLLFSMVVGGCVITASPFLVDLQDNEASYIWSLVCLMPILALCTADLLAALPRIRETRLGRLLTYSPAVIASGFAAVVSFGAAEFRKFGATRGTSFQPSVELSLVGWSVVSHVMVALLVLSILNLVSLLAFKTSKPARFKLIILGLLVSACLCMAFLQFFDKTFSFDGWHANLYAAVLSASLVMLALSMTAFFMAVKRIQIEERKGRKTLLLAIGIAISALTVLLPTILDGGDWNGVFQDTLTVMFWLVLGLCAYALRPQSRRYSAAALIGVIVVTLASYKGLQASEIFWAKSLGSTDDEITTTIESYGNGDASFQLVDHLLGNSRTPPCSDLCRILREYSNIRNAQAKIDLKLVDELVPAQREHPNVFIFVIDSMRPDYLGAYNPKADFTPNLDRLAADSVALRNVYTQYAGTSLSEPAIWSGAVLLHAHFMQPFYKVNSLEKLAETDNYQLVVSYDTVLAQLLPESATVTKLDTDKPWWNQFEVCSTVQQTKDLLDHRPDKSRPVLFYTQPMNLHQFARNSLPSAAAEGWRSRTGFNNRIAHEVHQVDSCLGSFVAFLKARGLYDNSIIIVTSDHGDATGELGRYSHSLWIYPEIMRVPLIFHLPRKMRSQMVYDDSRISALTDITPSLYYLLGHKPIVHNSLLGRPLFAAAKEELESYPRRNLFMASDVRASYGVLSDNGRWFYVTYDRPAESMLFDLMNDPSAQHDVLTIDTKKKYDKEIIENLQAIAAFYQYQPQVSSWLSASKSKYK